MDSNYVRSRCVSVDLYDATFKYFPILEYRSDYQEFFWYLCLGAHFDKDHSKLLLCRETIAVLLEREPKNFVAQDFFEQFRRDVLQGDNFSGTSITKTAAGCWARVELGEFTNILNAEFAGCFCHRPRVYLDGSSYSAAKARKVRAKERGMANSRRGYGSEALFIQKYLNSLERNLFFKNFVSNHQRTLNFVLGKFQGTERDKELRLLKRIECQLQPFYGSSPKENTVRIFSYAHIPQLKREVRKIYTRGWIDADLKCAQLAICARLWEIPTVLQFLDQEQNVWKHLSIELDIPESQWKQAKAALKEALYSLCYGMEEVRIRCLLARNLVSNGVDRRFARHFLNIPLIRDVLFARRRAIERVTEMGGEKTAYGKFLQVTENLQPRDILAQIAQSWEMKAIYPAFALTADNLDFKIMIYQFDGFTTQFTRRREEWQAKIKLAVDKRAQEFDIPTRLEWDTEQNAEADDLPAKYTVAA